MADGAQINLASNGPVSFSLEEAVKVLDATRVHTPFLVVFGDKTILCTQEDAQSGVALQRLTGLSRLSDALSKTPSPNVQALRSGKPVLHPRVAEILDALRQKN